MSYLFMTSYRLSSEFQLNLLPQMYIMNPYRSTNYSSSLSSTNNNRLTPTTRKNLILYILLKSPSRTLGKYFLTHLPMHCILSSCLNLHVPNSN